MAQKTYVSYFVPSSGKTGDIFHTIDHFSSKDMIIEDCGCVKPDLERNKYHYSREGLSFIAITSRPSLIRKISDRYGAKLASTLEPGDELPDMLIAQPISLYKLLSTHRDGKFPSIKFNLVIIDEPENLPYDIFASTVQHCASLDDSSMFDTLASENKANLIDLACNNCNSSANSVNSVNASAGQPNNSSKAKNKQQKREISYPDVMETARDNANAVVLRYILGTSIVRHITCTSASRACTESLFVSMFRYSLLPEIKCNMKHANKPTNPAKRAPTRDEDKLITVIPPIVKANMKIFHHRFGLHQLTFPDEIHPHILKEFSHFEHSIPQHGTNVIKSATILANARMRIEKERKRIRRDIMREIRDMHDDLDEMLEDAVNELHSSDYDYHDSQTIAHDHRAIAHGSQAIAHNGQMMMSEDEILYNMRSMIFSKNNCFYTDKLIKLPSPYEAISVKLWQKRIKTVASWGHVKTILIMTNNLEETRAALREIDITETYNTEDIMRGHLPELWRTYYPCESRKHKDYIESPEIFDTQRAERVLFSDFGRSIIIDERNKRDNDKPSANKPNNDKVRDIKGPIIVIHSSKASSFVKLHRPATFAQDEADLIFGATQCDRIPPDYIFAFCGSCEKGPRALHRMFYYYPSSKIILCANETDKKLNPDIFAKLPAISDPMEKLARINTLSRSMKIAENLNTYLTRYAAGEYHTSFELRMNRGE